MTTPVSGHFRPLSISGVSVTRITQTTAVITWTVSDYATGQVQYGTTTSYGLLSTFEPSYQYKTHVQTIKGLPAGSRIHFRLLSRARDGRSVVSQDYAFTTLAAQPLPPPPVPGATRASAGSATGKGSAMTSLIIYLGSVVAAFLSSAVQTNAFQA